jgi:hypothetical protein
MWQHEKGELTTQQFIKQALEGIFRHFFQCLKIIDCIKTSGEANYFTAG